MISESGKSHNGHKSRTNDVTYTNFNCKAVEVTAIGKVNSKKSGRKINRWRRRIKKHDVPDSSRYRCTAIKNSISFCAKLH